MNLLSRSEEIILATILKLKKGAFGVSIREKIYHDTGDRWSFASIYQPLNRLVWKKYVKRVLGESASGRGGAIRYDYTVTREGKKALLEIRSAHDRI